MNCNACGPRRVMTQLRIAQRANRTSAVNAARFGSNGCSAEVFGQEFKNGRGIR